MYYFLKRKKSGTATNKKIPATARGRDRERLAPDLQHPQFAERSQSTDSNKKHPPTQRSLGCDWKIKATYGQLL
jgi:hypothetical protein